MNDQRPSSRNAASSYTVPLYDTTGLTLALANPYAQHASSHYYYQAYAQAYSNPRPRTTADGYTLSSTYVPGMAGPISRTTLIPSPRGQPSVQTRSQTAVKPILNHLTHGSWYQPGNSRCARQGCPFTGSRKSVETHMMDRHFIFPPGWEKRGEWDADPSLRGKPIAIQGTSLVLDTPEAINAWIAERKRRFPTEEKVQDKKRKLEEAVARGQLTSEQVGASTRKKYKRNAFAEGGSKGSHGRGYQRGRDRRRGGLVKPRIESVGGPSHLTDAKTECTRATSPYSTSTISADEAPEVMSSRAPTMPPCVAKVGARHDEEVQKSHTWPREWSRRIPQPKKPLRNPFVSRSTLLRNLLLPEIRITVSNLSQSIHFLVENDFLRGVELRPGEAQEQMIEVLGGGEAPCSVQPPLSEGPPGHGTDLNLFECQGEKEYSS